MSVELHNNLLWFYSFETVFFKATAAWLQVASIHLAIDGAQMTDLTLPEKG